MPDPAVAAGPYGEGYEYDDDILDAWEQGYYRSFEV
jgi:hypothetical protein